MEGTSLVVQWLRLYPRKAGGLGLSPVLQGTRSHMPQLRPSAAKRKEEGLNITSYL